MYRSKLAGVTAIKRSARPLPALLITPLRVQGMLLTASRVASQFLIKMTSNHENSLMYRSMEEFEIPLP